MYSDRFAPGSAIPARMSLALSLHNVFDPLNHRVRDDIAFMDLFLADGSNQGDVDLTLRYCRHLAQLASCFERSKASFPLLCRPMQFHVTFPVSLGLQDQMQLQQTTQLLQGEVYRTSCHLLALMLSTLSLGRLACMQLCAQLPRMDPSAPPALHLVSDLAGTSANLLATFETLRGVIGIFHFCLTEVVPRASEVMRILSEKVAGFSDQFRSTYHTLRAMCCWVAASKASREPLCGGDTVHRDRWVVKLLSECASVVDFMRTHGLHAPRIATALRGSALYECDLRMAFIMRATRDASSNSMADSLAFALVSRADSVPVPRVHDLTAWHACESGTRLHAAGGVTWSASDIEHHTSLDALPLTPGDTVLQAALSPLLGSAFEPLCASIRR